MRPLEELLEAWKRRVAGVANQRIGGEEIRPLRAVCRRARRPLEVPPRSYTYKCAD